MMVSSSGGKADDRIGILGEYDVAKARRTAADLARRMGFTRTAIYRLCTAVSELGNNLVFHASHGGWIRIAVVRCEGRSGIEVVVEDDGPGIADLALAMTDGFSTGGGLGGGLPGSRRLVDDFEIESRLGMGTRVMVRIWLL